MKHRTNTMLFFSWLYAVAAFFMFLFLCSPELSGMFGRGHSDGVVAAVAAKAE